MLIELADKSNEIEFKITELPIPELLNYARTKLENKGILKFNTQPKPYCYLKVDDAYIHQLYPLLPKMKLSIPNYFNFIGAVGAHISVLYSNEIQQIINIKEIKNSFSFVPDSLCCTEVFGRRIVMLIVKSPALEAFRIQYGFTPKLNYRGLMVPFHITLAEGMQPHVT